MQLIDIDLEFLKAYVQVHPTPGVLKFPEAGPCLRILCDRLSCNSRDASQSIETLW